MRKKRSLKSIKISAVIVFLVMFVILNGFAHIQIMSRKNEEKFKAAYTAEITMRRIESQLNKYLEKSDFLKHTIEAGYEVSDQQFAQVAELMQDGNGVLEAIELAEDGIVTQAYPLEPNRQAIGLNMFENDERRASAYLAKESGKYTIAGPFELVQGGVGALLFDPIYRDGENGEQYFWGFSILVVNWEAFIQELNLDQLEEASYDYRIWKTDPSSGGQITLAQCEDPQEEDALEVTCDVPNDRWYFEIQPKGGWYSKAQLALDSILCILIAVLVTLVYWQFSIRRYKDALYAEEIEASAHKERAANEAKTRFLFNMSHDIRTPMNAIIGFSELLERHIDEHDKVQDYIEKIRNSSDFLLSIINHVLEMARIESGEEELQEANQNIAELVASLNDVFVSTTHEKNLNCSYELDIQHENVICDVTKVRQIFLNIVSNAVKYTPSGGKVVVKITEIPCGIEGHASYRVQVSDTGVGMSADYLPHVFEAFTREHTSTETEVIGTGLGMPIVKALVDLMGGTIHVESEAGMGTTITIELTFLIADVSADPSQEMPFTPADSILAHETRILIAEDNDLNAEITQTILEEYGFMTERAEDGDVCVRMLREHPVHYYDVVLMDVQMPHMDGYEATREIRMMDNETASIPIIAMTANAFDEDRKKAFAAGMNGYIAKPVNINVLLQTLHDHMNN